MRIARIILVLGVLSLSTHALSSSLSVEDYRRLPMDEQARLLQAAYDSVNVAFAFAGVERANDAPAGRTLVACLKDRDSSWLFRVVNEYLDKAPFTPPSFGAAFTQAMAWKCGILSFVPKK